MSLIGALLVRIDPRVRKRVRSRLTSMAGAEIVAEQDDGFAVLLESESARKQACKHEEIAGWFGVQDAQVVFGARVDPNLAAGESG